MSRSAPALVPLFRSEQQLRLLATLFAPDTEELTIGELAQRAEVSQATASREVARLADHGIVVTRSLGRNTLVSANHALPWAPTLRSLLDQTVGVVGRLGEALSRVAGIEEAFVFGSWAARLSGEPGPPPRDVDVLVVGTAALRSVRQACTQIERDLRVEINPVVVERDRWEHPDADAFMAQIQSRPHVPIPVPRS